MTESQSRYSIMDELSNRKIKTRQEIAKLESEMDERIHQTEKTIKNIENSIKNKEDNYEQDYLDKNRELTVSLNLFEADFIREKEKREANIADLKENYKTNFSSWKKKQSEEVNSIKIGLERFKETQKAKLKEQENIFTEIESSINDLKDMSKDQS